MGSEVDSTETRAEEGVNVHIRCSNGSKFTVRTSLGSTVGSFKQVLARNCDVPAEQQRLIYKGRILKDEQTLESYDLQAEHTVHVVKGSPSGSAASPPAVPSSGTANSTPVVTRGVGSDGGGNAGLGASLFPDLGLNPLGETRGVAELFGSGLPELEQMQQQLTQNPNIMRDIMNMPAMQSLMNNPELLRSLIMSNPQMRELIDRNPELAHVLNDPDVIRQTLEVARNPELMREMMRNTDRAMSNIEATPEGFNMLRRMYENVQEPFLNATTMGTNARNDTASNPFAALLGNQGSAQARDGNLTNNNNSSTPGSEAGSGPTVPNTNPLPNPWSSTGGSSQTNTNTRPTASMNARPSAAAGLGGVGLVGLDQMFDGGTDATMLNQQMQNPAISQLMQNVLSNPQYMNHLQSMVDMDPQVREMMQNPEILRQLTSPETLQQMLSLQQSLLSLSGTQTTRDRDGSQTGGAGGALSNARLELLMNMFGNLGAGNFGGLENPDVPPEELYATQLAQLQEMGFLDTAENIRALRASSGNVHAAVERLLGNPGQ
ncbi:hypothetical protein SAY87_002730 [Trapa incisa]|uniref:Ubiquitin domain-containing protein DSK2a-like n=1 Tax=Trapa incisa TaxID=236973 RepID=A0AAN7JUW3_9MYRT|nr:hypothetical protein SAY87_002730 [Trapa incisa]